MKNRNAKIRNATAVKSSGISFKSQAEKMVYTTLLDHNIKAQYEPQTFILWEGFSPKTPFYDKESDSQLRKREAKGPRRLSLKMDKIIGIRYTPDFYFKYGDLDVWIEVKGIENDVFYIKKKLFRKYLDNLLDSKGQKSIFFEIYTKAQLLQALEIIGNYENTSRED